jgi:hypothetical protein
MKQIYILSLFYITNSVAQTTFDWENSTDNGATIEQTVNTVTATFTVSSADPLLIDGNGFGGSSEFVVASTNNNVDNNATITFSSPINITSLFALNGSGENPDADWTFIPTGGTNSDVIANVPGAGNGITVTLNWIDITEITITSASGRDWFAFDNIMSDFTLSTQEFENGNTIKLFPNPTTEYIQISGLKNTENYSIYNVIGSEILKGSISIDEIIDVKNYSNGLYFLKFENGNTIKFLKE